MGVDLGDARVHDDERANAAAQEVGARAFAFGQDVFLGEGESPSDTQLVAHELAHVAQGSVALNEGESEAESVAAGLGAEPSDRSAALQPALPPAPGASVIMRSPRPGAPGAPHLPVPRTGVKQLPLGVFSWVINATSPEAAMCNARFEHDPAKAEAKTVSFVQTVVAKTGDARTFPGGNAQDPVGQQDLYQRFVEPTEQRSIDFNAKTENDPFYGAKWKQTRRAFGEERGIGTPGTSMAGGAPSATLLDTPFQPQSRHGHGDLRITFETVAMVTETRQTLGSLKWGYQIKDDPLAPLELIGGRPEDCTEQADAAFDKALDLFYEAMFERIIDHFDADSAVLTPAHTSGLDVTWARLVSDPTLNVKIGGAADPTEADPQDISLQRAMAVRGYLMGKGNVSPDRIQVESYGFDWARVKTTAGTAEPANRRVQIRLYRARARRPAR